MCFFFFFLVFVLLVQLHTPLLVVFVVSGVVVVYLLTCPNSRLLLMRKLPAITDVCVCVIVLPLDSLEHSLPLYVILKTYRLGFWSSLRLLMNFVIEQNAIRL